MENNLEKIINKENDLSFIETGKKIILERNKEDYLTRICDIKRKENDYIFSHESHSYVSHSYSYSYDPTIDF